MLTISFINDSTSDVKKKSEIEQALQYTFRYVNHGEVSVIFDVESPTSTLGKIDTLIFITINNITGNFYRTYPSKEYLHTLVIGLSSTTRAMTEWRCTWYSPPVTMAREQSIVW